MAHPANLTHPVTMTAQSLSGRAWYLLWLAAGCLAAAFAVPKGLPGIALLTVAGTLAMLAVAIRLIAGRQVRRVDGVVDSLAFFVAHDAAPTICTDADGLVRYQNKSAGERFGAAEGRSLVQTLGDLFANPAAVQFRLQAKADALGAAREDLVMRLGHVRLSVHRLEGQGYLWRFEDMVERVRGERGAEAVGLPMLTASKTGTVLYMNESLRRLLGGRVMTLDRIFADLPLRPNGVHSVTGVTGAISVRVTEITGPSGRREIYLAPCDPEEVSGASTRRFFDELPVALLKLSTDGRVQMANRMARELLCHSMNGEVHLSELVEGLGRAVGDWLEDAVEGRALKRAEVVLARRAEADIYLQITLNRIVEDGVVSLVAVLNDATELKTLEAQFVQSQKMQAIGQLAGGVAHDFNNLLTAISGHCDLLLLRHDDGDSEYADLIQIRQNANRAASLVGQLLAFSRKQNLQPEVLDLRDSLGDLAHLLNRLVGERVRLTLNHDPELKPIRADRRQLEQVVMNLVVNARDAMSDGGEIRIDSRNVVLAEELCRDRAVVPPGSYVVVSVTDEGIGIAADRLQKVFEPFYTTKRTGEGTGLGLSMAYGIIKQTGGFIFCSSEPGAGATFRIFLPRHVAEAAPAVAETQERGAAPAAGGGEAKQQAVQDLSGSATILLVEDEDAVRMGGVRALSSRGYTVHEASSGVEALEIFEELGGKVDLVVSDVVMPEMDGPTLLGELIKRQPDIKFVFVSGYAEDAFARNLPEEAKFGFLPKPFTLKQLATTVKDMLDG